jgi:hypothetical protein
LPYQFIKLPREQSWGADWKLGYGSAGASPYQFMKLPRDPHPAIVPPLLIRLGARVPKSGGKRLKRAGTPDSKPATTKKDRRGAEREILRSYC